MQLTTVHKVMIGASIGASLLFSAWAGLRYGRDGSGAHLTLAGLGLAVAGALGIYLRGFVRRTRARRKPV